MPITNAALAQQIADLVAYWRTRDTEYAAWVAGTAAGGPYSNGTYPLTDYLLNVQYVKAPAAMQASVDGMVASASSYATTAQGHATAASAAQTAAVAARDLALSYRDAAIAARDLALSYKNFAASHETNAQSSATAANASAVAAAADAASINGDVAAADASAIAAAASASAAAASAVTAATFDPANFYTKVAADARYSQLGHTHDYLPLSGGTLTGALSVNMASGYVRAGADTQNLAIIFGVTYAGATNPIIRGYGGTSASSAGSLSISTPLTGNYVTFSNAVDGNLARVGGANALEVWRGAAWLAVSDSSHTHSYLPLSGGTLSSTLNGTQVSLTATGSHLTFYESDGPDANDRMVFDLNGGVINMYGYDNSAAAWRTFFQLTVATGAATYTVDTVNSRYIQGNSGTYGTIQVGGSTNSFAGIKFLSAHQARQLMFSTSGAQWGVYSETAGAWDAYYNGGFLHTTATLYKVPYCTWSVNADAKSAIMSRGTAAPSGGTDGDIYYQYV